MHGVERYLWHTCTSTHESSRVMLYGDYDAHTTQLDAALATTRHITVLLPGETRAKLKGTASIVKRKTRIIRLRANKLSESQYKECFGMFLKRNQC